MSDPNNPNIEKRDTPQWALYQRENFWKPNTGEVPLFNTGMSFSIALFPSPNALMQIHQADSSAEPGKLEELAKEKLSQGGWWVLRFPRLDVPSTDLR